MDGAGGRLHGARVPRPGLRRRLDALLETYDRGAHLASDPVSFVHRAPPGDQELVGLVAALLAFGNVVAIRASVARALDRLDHPGGLAALLSTASLDELEGRLAGFVHRVWRGEHLARLLHGAGRVRAVDGTLGAAFGAHLREAGELREGLARLADRLRGPEPDRGLAHLVPDPRAGSPCKRLLLYLRWMVRPADGVDLGLWSDRAPAAALVIPLDTHVHRIARNLGLTDRRDASWRTAVEVTDALRPFDRRDPVKYDFALCHLGVSRQCPSRRDDATCAPCALRRVCRAWRGALPAAETIGRRTPSG